MIQLKSIAEDGATMDRKLVFRLHALQRMFERAVTIEDVRIVLASGETIKTYPDDTP